MRHCSRCAGRVQALVRPGISTQDLEEAGRDAIAESAAPRAPVMDIRCGPRRYPAHTWHLGERGSGARHPFLPRILRDGDVVAIDVVVSHQGFVGDNAATYAVGAVSPRVQQLLERDRAVPAPGH
jgi:methionyl aminopeptidase